VSDYCAHASIVRYTHAPRTCNVRILRYTCVARTLCERAFRNVLRVSTHSIHFGVRTTINSRLIAIGISALFHAKRHAELFRLLQFLTYDLIVFNSAFNRQGFYISICRFDVEILMRVIKKLYLAEETFPFERQTPTSYKRSVDNSRLSLTVFELFTLNRFGHYRGAPSG
jgi:hypothetical protein